MALTCSSLSAVCGDHGSTILNNSYFTDKCIGIIVKCINTDRFCQIQLILKMIKSDIQIHFRVFIVCTGNYTVHMML